MDSEELAPTTVIRAAAERLAGLMGVLRDAHEDHMIAPGPHDDLSSPEHSAAAELVYRETLSDSYLRRIALTFGAVVVLMDLVAEHHRERTTQLQGHTVRGYMAAVAEHYVPDYEDHLVELPSLVLATQATPPIVRFDLLAGLASRASVLRYLDAAQWVVELADELPSLADIELDSRQLAAMVAGRPG